MTFFVFALIFIALLTLLNIINPSKKKRRSYQTTPEPPRKTKEQKEKELAEYWARIDQMRAEAAAQAAAPKASQVVTGTPEERPLVSDLSSPEWKEVQERVEAEKKAKRLARQRELRRMTPEEKQKEKKKKELQKKRKEAKEIFCDQKSHVKDYSNLSPEAAERKLERLKERDGWVDDDVYYGLMKIINGHYPVDHIPYDVIHAGPARVEEWFRETYDTAEYGISNAVFKEVGDILKPYHEAALLQELESVEPAALEDWMTEKKSKGIFFSDEVYKRLQKRWLLQFE